MDLILWRHAEALELRELKDDLDRSLTPKGERQAQRMAAWLNRQLPASTRVLVSPARRAQQTAAALDRKFKTVPVLLVGHQPTLGLAAAYLLSGQPQAWAVRKAGAWWLRAREREGQLQVVLHAVVSPDLM